MYSQVTSHAHAVINCCENDMNLNHRIIVIFPLPNPAPEGAGCEYCKRPGFFWLVYFIYLFAHLQDYETTAPLYIKFAQKLGNNPKWILLNFGMNRVKGKVKVTDMVKIVIWP